MLTVRPLSEQDMDFFMEMRYEAIYMPEGKPLKEELLSLPHIKKYSDGWGRKGDRAFIAFTSDQKRVGAVWYRLFSAENKGYGYVDDETPELGIAIVPEYRKQGIGTLLLEKIIEQAKLDGYKALSLSVDPRNEAAVQLYQKLGFEQCGISGTSWTMKRSLS
ncbi:ribosomal protein S18 acetylase RimI-like enzyme [Anoxybacillus calidus]|jgi:ribosomal protein S18 acetylase RimI-like enzyme|uniref:Ribosomal protein S18 acetylase RimI-like enzyme n=1 Tax=[Anoxybacillus] calidus TaxID=575178 RepID=A0A7V9Z2L1_9BACL|nr:GNAT family N-acetyltransferase [Anoxybacillus calidus]MBA2872942.1 ribosomal protein S18 acetylase RimI-like enzyme [Anoxybacillus calidus]